MPPSKSAGPALNPYHSPVPEQPQHTQPDHGGLPVTNRQADIAQQYHESTKLTYINLRNKPPLYKSYPGLPTVELPKEGLSLEAPTLPAVAGEIAQPSGDLDLRRLAQLLYYSAGVIRKARVRSAGEVHYRAAASAGALYPTEAYAVCGGVPGLEDGVYHFSPDNFRLTQLRAGDYRNALAEAAGDEEAVRRAPVTIVFTTIFWRSSWKYRSRGYRYCFWDNGTVAANLLAAAAALGFESRLLMGFVDQDVDRLVGADGEQEACVCLVPLGSGGMTPLVSPDHDEGLEAYHLEFRDQVDYPDVQETHAATRLLTSDEVRQWKGGHDRAEPGHGLESFGLDHPAAAALDGVDLEKVITSRGSTRRYLREDLAGERFSALLDYASRGVAADFLDGSSLLDVYLVVNGVEGLASGAYYLDTEHRRLELLREGALREAAGHLVFEQALGADASAVAFIMADLDRVLQRYGNRGYRAAQVEAGILGGRLYLSAYSLGFGASGITFFDGEVVEFFHPHSQGKEVMFVVTLGKTHPENRVIPFRSRVAVKLDALARGAGQS